LKREQGHYWVSVAQLIYFIRGQAGAIPVISTNFTNNINRLCRPANHVKIGQTVTY
jgi:hypothetical protein